MVRLDAKRIFDLALALPVAVMTLPVQAAVAAVVARKLGRPVLFRQERPGLHGKPFTMRKFRTMLPVNVELGLVDDESRMTEFGRWLRSTSLDELPTLWNVVKGDMSLVGPRPLLMHYLTRYSPEQARRHEVRPGMTGLAQVSGRNGLSWDDKFHLDVQYVERRCFALDLRIIRDTMLVVVRREGINGVGQVSMSEFVGTADVSAGAVCGAAQKNRGESLPSAGGWLLCGAVGLAIAAFAR